MDKLKVFLPYFRKYRIEFLLGIVALIFTDTLTLLVPWLIKDFIDALSGSLVKEKLFKYVLLIFLNKCKNYGFNR